MTELTDLSGKDLKPWLKYVQGLKALHEEEKKMNIWEKNKVLEIRKYNIWKENFTGWNL